MQRERFLELFDDALAREGLSMTRPDPADPLSGAVAPNLTVSLGNLYQACVATASEPEAMREVGKFIKTLKLAGSDSPVPGDWDDVRGNLLPLLRDKAWMHVNCLAPAARRGEDDYSVFPHRDLGAGFTALIGVDSESSIAMAKSTQLESWGKSFEEAFEEAIANLKGREAGACQDLGNGLYGWANGDDYESSRLLLPAFWESLPELAGDPVVLCPSKDAVLVTGSENPAGLSEMAHRAAAIMQSCRPLTGLALVRRAGAWRPFPDTSAGGAEELRALRRQWLALLHRQQKELLDGILERQSRDFFVASYETVPQLPGLAGEQSFTTWTEGADSWLPQADYVFFVRDRDDISFAQWPAVRSVLGTRMRDTGHYPPRYEVCGFPDAEEFAAMGAQPLMRKEKKKGLAALLPW